MVLGALEYSIPIQTILDLMSANDITFYTVEWFVLASDEEFVVASNQTFTFNIDAEVYFLSVGNENLIPKSFSLYQNYPNPFNPITHIQYDISEKTNVTISIYDMTGRLVASFQEGNREPGQYLISWNALDEVGKQLSGGVYIYQIQTEKFIKSKKMILLK
jgi:hypothetical protein